MKKKKEKNSEVGFKFFTSEQLVVINRALHIFCASRDETDDSFWVADDLISDLPKRSVKVEAKKK